MTNVPMGDYPLHFSSAARECAIVYFVLPSVLAFQLRDRCPPSGVPEDQRHPLRARGVFSADTPTAVRFLDEGLFRVAARYEALLEVALEPLSLPADGAAVFRYLPRADS